MNQTCAIHASVHLWRLHFENVSKLGQLIYRPTKHPTMTPQRPSNKATNKATNHPSNLAINQSTSCTSACYSESQPIEQSIVNFLQWVNASVCHMQSVGRSLTWILARTALIQGIQLIDVYVGHTVCVSQYNITALFRFDCILTIFTPGLSGWMHDWVNFVRSAQVVYLISGKLPEIMLVSYSKRYEYT